MRRTTTTATAVLALLGTACAGDPPTQAGPPLATPTFDISDGANAGLEGFYWLVPTLKGGPTFAGTFDPSLEPVIEICPIASDAPDGLSACVGPIIRTLSGDTQPEIVRVDLENENYSVTWQSTSGSGIVLGSTYRANIRVDARTIGWLDLVVVAKQRDVADVPAGFVGLVVGKPFLFKWRIETGIPGAVAVTPDPVTIKDDETQLFTATVTDLHGDVLADADVSWTIDDVTIATLGPTSGSTNASGQTTTTATPAGTLGSTIVRASASGVQGTASLTVETSCGPDSEDTDGDRLPDCFETNTGTFVSTTDTGTDPNNPDSDGDAINDGDEVLGTELGLDLPLMGVSPLRRDILLEYDWFDDALSCGAHTHRPEAAALARVTASFAAAPVSNPDGSTGINFIHDYGQGGVFTGGNLIADADGVIAGGVGDADFTAYKAANFAANRNGYFHYVLNPRRYGTNSSSSGQAEITGDDLIVSLQCFQSETNVANTIVHELGHNLSLRHGGFENQNHKPNYNSVMNYLYQFPGIDNDCTPPGNGVLSFSTGSRIPLDENNLSEPAGVCGNPPGPGWDWNVDGDATDVALVRNLNPQWSTVRSVLQDYNDWANLNLGGIGDASGLGARMQTEIVSCQNVPPGAEGS